MCTPDSAGYDGANDANELLYFAKTIQFPLQLITDRFSHSLPQWIQKRIWNYMWVSSLHSPPVLRSNYISMLILMLIKRRHLCNPFRYLLNSLVRSQLVRPTVNKCRIIAIATQWEQKSINWHISFRSRRWSEVKGQKELFSLLSLL